MLRKVCFIVGSADILMEKEPVVTFLWDSLQYYHVTSEFEWYVYYRHSEFFSELQIYLYKIYVKKS